MKTTDVTAPIMLEENLTITTAIPLQATLKPLKGAPVVLNAASVKHLDMPGFQILAAAFDAWKNEGISFEIIDPSDDFQKNLESLGFNTTHFSNTKAV